MSQSDELLLRECRGMLEAMCSTYTRWEDVKSMLTRIDARLAQPEAAPVAGQRLWLWKNGAEYVAYNNEYPCESPDGDPLTPGEPAATAIFKSSHPRRPSYASTLDRVYDPILGATLARPRGKFPNIPAAPVAAQPTEPVQLPPLTDLMYHAVRGSEYHFTSGGPGAVVGYLDDDCLDEIWDNINTALRVAGVSAAQPDALAKFLSRLEVHSAPDWPCGFAFTVRDIPGRFENAEAAHNAYVTDEALRGKHG